MKSLDNVFGRSPVILSDSDVGRGRGRRGAVSRIQLAGFFVLLLVLLLSTLVPLPPLVFRLHSRNRRVRFNTRRFLPPTFTYFSLTSLREHFKKRATDPCAIRRVRAVGEFSTISLNSKNFTLASVKDVIIKTWTPN